MLATCWQNVKMSKILKKLCCFATSCLTDTKFACQTCVGWKTTDRPTLMKVSKLQKYLPKVYFDSFEKNKNSFILFFFTISSIVSWQKKVGIQLYTAFFGLYTAHIPKFLYSVSYTKIFGFEFF